MDKDISDILHQITRKEDQTPYIIKNVEDGLKKRDEEITRLREENKRLKDEAYKDSELQMMKSKCKAIKEELNRGFQISEDEELMINAWMTSHVINEHKRFGTRNGQFKYEFQDFAEVSVGSVVCTECGESFTFRQY